MSSNQFGARYILSDRELLHPRLQKDIEERVNYELALSLARELVKKKFGEITVKREYSSHKEDPYYSLIIPPGGTLYELECFVLSRQEYLEYKKLKNLFGGM